MNKIEKIENITYKFILLIIVLLNICIGSNIKEPIWLIQAVISLYTIIYVIIKKINKEKNLIIKSKIDIAVTIFMISVFLPLIFKTYVSQEGCINFILKYWSIYGVYILVRNSITNKKREKGIITTLIISSIIPITFGYDKLLKINIFEKFLDYINAVKIEDTRMISTFEYANTFASYLGFTTSLAIGSFLNTDKKISKILYGIYIVISSITILLTQSKFVLALIAFIILLFIIKGILQKKISKKWIIVGMIFIISFFIYFLIAINISKPLKIGEEKNCVIRGIEKNTQYNLEFDIKANTDKTYDTFEIYIVEVTRYFSEKTIGRLSFSDFKGTKQIDVKTDDVVDHIELRFINKLEQELVINDFKINENKYILEYKIIPDEIVRIFTTFNFKNSSVWQRADYWKDGVDILKDNWLIGAGGNAWRMLYGQTQDYLYYAKEAHCYVLEIWMSFGLLGIISYLFILAIIIKVGIDLLNKNRQDKKQYRTILSILVGISIIIIHSFMDFDMSYLIIEMLFFIFLAIINREEKEIENKKNQITAKQIIDYTILLIFILISIGNILGLIANIVEDETGIKSKKIAPWISRYKYNEIIYLENNNKEPENKIKFVKKYIQEEPYQYQNIMYEIMKDTILETINTENINQKIEDIEFLKNTIKNVKRDRKYDINEIQKKADIILEFSSQLIEKSNELKNDELKQQAIDLLNILIDEYKENSKIFLEYDKNQQGKTISNMKFETYKSTINRVHILLKK